MALWNWYREFKLSNCSLKFKERGLKATKFYCKDSTQLKYKFYNLGKMEKSSEIKRN